MGKQQLMKHHQERCQVSSVGSESFYLPTFPSWAHWKWFKIDSSRSPLTFACNAIKSPGGVEFVQLGRLGRGGRRSGENLQWMIAVGSKRRRRRRRSVYVRCDPLCCILLAVDFSINRYEQLLRRCGTQQCLRIYCINTVFIIYSVHSDWHRREVVVDMPKRD